MTLPLRVERPNVPASRRCSARAIESSRWRRLTATASSASSAVKGSASSSCRRARWRLGGRIVPPRLSRRGAAALVLARHATTLEPFVVHEYFLPPGDHRRHTAHVAATRRSMRRRLPARPTRTRAEPICLRSLGPRWMGLVCSPRPMVAALFEDPVRMNVGQFSSAALMASGLAGVVMPSSVSSALDLPATTARGIAETRAGLGGTYAALGGWALVSRDPAAQTAVGVTWLERPGPGWRGWSSTSRGPTARSGPIWPPRSPSGWRPWPAHGEHALRSDRDPSLLSPRRPDQAGGSSSTRDRRRSLDGPERRHQLETSFGAPTDSWSAAGRPRAPTSSS